jgi:hypothetical protein
MDLPTSVRSEMKGTLIRANHRASRLATNLVYYDAYQTKHYGALRSRDLKTWEGVTSKLELPDEDTPFRMRHGTIIEVSPELVVALRKK